MYRKRTASHWEGYKLAFGLSVVEYWHGLSCKYMDKYLHQWKAWRYRHSRSGALLPSPSHHSAWSPSGGTLSGHLWTSPCSNPRKHTLSWTFLLPYLYTCMYICYGHFEVTSKYMWEDLSATYVWLWVSAVHCLVFSHHNVCHCRMMKYSWVGFKKHNQT